jgi:hypothetical protein
LAGKLDLKNQKGATVLSWTRQITNPKFLLIQIFILFALPAVMAFFLYHKIPIQNLNPLSIVSVTATINLILWILIALQVILNYPLIRKFSLKFIVEINLFLLLIYVITFKILSKALSLKGTPLPGSDIRGDLLAIVNMAKIAERQYWSDSSYPPLWPTIIGNLARTLDVHVLSLFKPAEFVVLIIAPILVLFVWRLILKPWMALVIAINQTLNFSFDYKTLTLNLFIPILIFIIIEIKKGVENSFLKFFVLGFLIGIILLMYFGYLYWLIPFLLLSILLIIFSKNRKKYIQRHTNLYLGLSAGLGPVVLVHLRSLESIYFYYLTLAVITIISFILQKNKLLRKLFDSVITLGIFLGLSAALLWLRAKDTWVEGGIEKDDPTVKSIISLSGVNLLLFLIIVVGFYLIVMNTIDLTPIFSLIGFYVSSTIFMYLIAGQMQITSRVDLWPRALEVQRYTLNLVFLLIFIFVVEVLLKRYDLRSFINLNNQNIFYLISFILFISGSYLVSSLGSSTHSSMPYHAFTGAWFAHQGCTNPHEDPMLSKVFEYNPDIQTFLRENCSLADWPAIPKID